MPVALIQEFTVEGDDRSTTNYDAIAERLNAGADPPDGLIVHSAGWDEGSGVFRIFDLWETREQGERFMRDRLRPIVEELMATREDATPPERESWYELYDLVST
jgi:hypothetical protein